MIEAAACPECGKKIKAPNPYLEGTSYGPVMLAVVNALFARAVTDEDIAHLVRELFGVRTCTNAVKHARTAVSEYDRHDEMPLSRIIPHVDLDYLSVEVSYALFSKYG